MIVIYGTRLYGKVDHVPGLFYVATTFGHIDFLPLVPTGSYLILDDGTGEKGVKIGLHLKSVLTGWLRAGCFVAAPLLVVAAMIEGGSHRAGHTSPWGLALTGVALLAVAILSYFITRAGRHRAVALAERANLDPTFVHDHFDRREGKTPDGPRVALDDPRLDEAMKPWSPEHLRENVQ